MKISFDLRFANRPGGGGVYVTRLITTLVRDYPEIQWQLYHNPWCPHQRQLTDRLLRDHPNAALDLIPVAAPLLSIRQHLEYRRFRDPADLYHYPHFDLPLTLRDIPVVQTIHDIYPLSDPAYCSTLKRLYFSRLIRSAAARAARIIAVSAYTKNQIIRYLNTPAEKITVVHQSHDPAFRPIDGPDRLNPLREKYHLPPRFLFYTGNHKPHKNLPRLIRAYARLPDRLRQPYPLVLTGGRTPQAQKLLALANKLKIADRLQFLGWVHPEELPGLYNLASLVVLPSLYEGFGYAAVEALACGVPLVCANTGAIPEVVGSAGRQFDPYQVDHIHVVLVEALENDVDNPAVRSNALRQARLFSPEKTARETHAVYRTVAD